MRAALAVMSFAFVTAASAQAFTGSESHRLETISPG